MFEISQLPSDDIGIRMAMAEDHRIIGQIVVRSARAGYPVAAPVFKPDPKGRCCPTFDEPSLRWFEDVPNGRFILQEWNPRLFCWQAIPLHLSRPSTKVEGP